MPFSQATTKCTALNEMITRFNTINAWVASEICSHPIIRKRAEVIVQVCFNSLDSRCEAHYHPKVDCCQLPVIFNRFSSSRSHGISCISKISTLCLL